MARDEDIRGMEELFKALQGLPDKIAIKVRRKALQTTAQELTKVAKHAVPRFDLTPKPDKPNPYAVLRRAIHRVTPKARPGRGRPMRYTVSVRSGKAERAGADLGVYASGKKKGQSKGVRKYSRDAYWWHWVESGTKNRQTKKKGGRGRVQAQHVFREAFEMNADLAIQAGEKAGFAELKKILAQQAAKAKTPSKP